MPTRLEQLDREIQEAQRALNQQMDYEMVYNHNPQLRPTPNLDACRRRLRQLEQDRLIEAEVEKRLRSRME